MISKLIRAITLAVVISVLAGCSKNTDKPQAATPQVPAKSDDVATERAKLSNDDRSLVEAQEWCVISTDERLGSMGPPLKLDIKGQAVFVCCKGCKKKAEADPDKTLATLADLKAKKASSKPVAP